MTERIQKILSARGLCSRRQAEEMIRQGRVTCNGSVCTLGQSADPDTVEICLDGVAIPSEQKNIYLLLHKPKGYVTTLSDERGRKNVTQLVESCGTRVYPIGRLDMDSEGLLLLTNDGAFANRLMHPRHEIDKVYRVAVTGYSDAGLATLKKPMCLDGYRLRVPGVELLNVSGTDAQMLITIHEGRNRQVRRMCAAAGMRVKRLIRIKEGSLELGDLPAGKWRYLTACEVEELQRLSE